jgi:hypothetical protein
MKQPKKPMIERYAYKNYLGAYTLHNLDQLPGVKGFELDLWGRMRRVGPVPPSIHLLARNSVPRVAASVAVSGWHGSSDTRLIRIPAWATCAESQLLSWHRADGVGGLIQQPRPLDGWRMTKIPQARMSNAWVAVAGVAPDFVEQYYSANGLEMSGAGAPRL